MEETLQFAPVDHGLFEFVLGVEDGICFVAVPVEPSPSHLLFASPGDADGAGRIVAAYINVVTALRESMLNGS